jgi:hypothetical protein
MSDKHQGISNRETEDEESAERAEHPPEGENESESESSAKAGSRSAAQKEAGTRYPDRAMPPSKKVPGAFGKE